MIIKFIINVLNILYQEKAKRKIVSWTIPESGCSTISSAEEEAYPTQFLATQVKVPASSGNTSLITRVALLSVS